MTTQGLSPQTRTALTECVQTIESSFPLELVIAVRTRSATYLTSAIGLGIACSIATLGYMLFAPPYFSWLSIWITPPAVGLLIVIVCYRLPLLHRLMTPKKQQREQVNKNTQAIFVELKVHNTSHRRGILLLLSLWEKRAHLVLDSGLASRTNAQRKSQAENHLSDILSSTKLSPASTAHIQSVITTWLSTERFGDNIESIGSTTNQLPDNVHYESGQ